MIEKLKKRIFLILTSFVAIVGLLIVFSINYTSYTSLKDTCYYEIERATYFRLEDPSLTVDLVVLTRSNNLYQITFNSSSLSISKVTSLLQQIEEENSTIGNISYYYYTYTDNRVLILNCQSLYQSFYQSLIASIILLVLSIVVFAYIANKIAQWIVRPVAEAFDKQKTFISDVSHELKTPIAIIQTNTELLQLDGTNKQLDYIDYETKRMNNLITQLLQLTKIEDGKDQYELLKDNLSNCVYKAAMPFESLAFEKNMHLEYDIEENIEYTFNDGLISQLVTILLDNALKHTYPEGEIKVSLHKNNGNITLKVSNQGDPIDEKDRERIFDRFYRVDKARNRSEGRYGLGLAIAKSIMENHHGSIKVECKDGYTIFICTM